MLQLSETKELPVNIQRIVVDLEGASFGINERLTITLPSGAQFKFSPDGEHDFADFLRRRGYSIGKKYFEQQPDAWRWLNSISRDIGQRTLLVQGDTIVGTANPECYVITDSEIRAMLSGKIATETSECCQTITCANTPETGIEVKIHYSGMVKVSGKVWWQGGTINVYDTAARKTHKLHEACQGKPRALENIRDDIVMNSATALRAAGRIAAMKNIPLTRWDIETFFREARGVMTATRSDVRKTYKRTSRTHGENHLSFLHALLETQRQRPEESEALADAAGLLLLSTSTHAQSPSVAFSLPGPHG